MRGATLLPPSPKVECLDFKIVRRNTVLGFATVRHPSGLIMSDIPVCRSGDRTWAGLPGRPQVGKDGMAIRTAEGKLAYAKILWFSDKAIERRWSESVIAGLRAAYPNALDAEGWE